MRLPDVVASFDGHHASRVPSFLISSLFRILLLRMSNLLVFLCYVALLCLRLSSALHLLHPLSITSLRVLSAKYPYSKMFVGGLSWDTTDGTFFPPLYHIPLTAPFCNVMSIFANLC